MTILGRHRNDQQLQRGSATVEFALVVPLFVTMLMFSMFLTDLARVKLKVQEAGRYVTWEMTSYLLSDYGANGPTPNHSGNFDEAMNKTVLEAQERYRDLDSVEDDSTPFASFDLGTMTAQVQNQEVQFVNTSLIQDIPGAGPLLSDILQGAISGPANSAISFLGYDTRGRVQSTVNMTVNMRMGALPRNYYDQGPEGFYQTDHWGGYDLSQYNMASRLTMVVNPWHLADGGDVVARDGRAGRHNSDGKSGMWQQTKRMTFLGLAQRLQDMVPLFDTIENYLPIPQILGTYVVSHNYLREGKSYQDGANCNFPGHDAKIGLTDQSSILHEDDRQMRCYDTVPFRDTQAYDKSMYRKLFNARGDWFMGCSNPMADDPTMTQVYGSDEQADKTICANDQVAPN